jgi:hypothetical protein
MILSLLQRKVVYIPIKSFCFLFLNVALKKAIKFCRDSPNKEFYCYFFEPMARTNCTEISLIVSIASANFNNTIDTIQIVIKSLFYFGISLHKLEPHYKI